MKLLIISSFYEIALNSILSKEDFGKSYWEINSILVQSHFRFYTSIFNYAKEHEIEAQIIFPNISFLQNKWKIENNCSDTSTLKSQIEKSNADMILMNSDFNFYEEVKTYAKVPVAGWVSCPIDKPIDFSWLSHVFTLYPPHLQFFKNKNIPVSLVSAGFDEQLILKNKIASIPFSFVGGISPMHTNRKMALEKLIQHTPIQIWGYGYDSPNVLKNIAKKILYFNSFTKRYQGQAWGLKMFEILGNSKITFNIHGDFVETPFVNMRLYEATGMGTLLFTEYHEALNEKFILEKELVTYKNIHEAIEKYQYFSKNPQEAEMIALAGQKRTLSDYNYKNSLKIIFDILKSLV